MGERRGKRRGEGRSVSLGEVKARTGQARQVLGQGMGCRSGEGEGRGRATQPQLKLNGKTVIN